MNPRTDRLFCGPLLVICHFLDWGQVQNVDMGLVTPWVRLQSKDSEI